MTAVPRELLGDPESHPVTTPIRHHHPRADVGTLGEHTRRVHHMGSLFDQDIGNVGSASGRQNYRVGPDLIDERAIDPDSQLYLGSGDAHLAIQIGDDSAELGTLGEQARKLHLPTERDFLLVKGEKPS